MLIISLLGVIAVWIIGNTISKLTRGVNKTAEVLRDPETGNKLRRWAAKLDALGKRKL